MRAFVNTILLFSILLLLALIAFYAHRRQAASYEGKDYTIGQAPGELLDAFGSIFSSDSKAESLGTGTNASIPDEPTTPPEEQTSMQEALDAWRRGRSLYLDGDFSAALPHLVRSMGRGEGAQNGQASTLESRARLFVELLGGIRLGESLNGPAQALLALPSGDPFVAELVSEDDDHISFRRKDGFSARVKKSDLRELTVARTPEQKRALAGTVYRRRHTVLSGAESYLELARFCQAHGLADHLTYLLERALEEPGDALESALFDRWKSSFNAGDIPRSEILLGLLKRFFRRGDLTRRAVTASAPDPAGRPRIDPVGPDGGTGRAPPSGVGGTSVRSPRSTDPKVNELLEKADRIRGEADDHYMNAQPGSDNRAEHRKKAIELYEEAIGLYEEVEERWGVDLQRIFKDILQKRYHLLKDMPVR